jgi:hypothetical protein
MTKVRAKYHMLEKQLNHYHHQLKFAMINGYVDADSLPLAMAAISLDTHGGGHHSSSSSSSNNNNHRYNAYANENYQGYDHHSTKTPRGMGRTPARRTPLRTPQQQGEHTGEITYTGAGQSPIHNAVPSPYQPGGKSMMPQHNVHQVGGLYTGPNGKSVMIMPSAASVPVPAASSASTLSQQVRFPMRSSGPNVARSPLGSARSLVSSINRI